MQKEKEGTFPNWLAFFDTFSALHAPDAETQKNELKKHVKKKICCVWKRSHICEVSLLFLIIYILQSWLILELAFVFIYAMDLMLRHLCYDEYDKNGKLMNKNCFRSFMPYIIIGNGVLVLAMIFIVSVFDNDDSKSFTTAMTHVYLLTRIIRPFYVIHRSRRLYLLLKSVIQSVSALLSLFSLMILVWILFTAVGFALFAHLNSVGSNAYFTSFFKAFDSLFIFQASAYFPDIMLENYHKCQAIAMYFLIYAFFATYFLVPLSFAVIYRKYEQLLQNKQNIKTGGKKAAFHQLETNNVIYFDQFYQIYKHFHTRRLCGNWSLPQCKKTGRLEERCARDRYNRMVKNAVTDVNSLDSGILECGPTASLLNDASNVPVQPPDKGMNLNQFIDNIELIVESQTTTVVVLEAQTYLENVIASNEADLKEMQASDSDNVTKWKLWYLHMLLKFHKSRRKCLEYLNHKHANAVIAVITTLLLLIIMIDLLAEDTDTQPFGICQTIVIWLFMSEIVIKMFGIGPCRFFKQNTCLNLFNFLVSIVLVVADIAVLSGYWKQLENIECVSILVILRSLHIIGDCLDLIWLIIKQYRHLFQLQCCLIYILAVIGCTVFDDVISESVVYDKCAGNDSDDFWCELYDGNYYSLNFNSFSHAIVLLLSLLVMSNWHTVVDMYSKAYGQSAKIYFIIVYLATILIVMNVLCACVLDVYINNWQNWLKSRDTYHMLQIKLMRAKNANEGLLINVVAIKPKTGLNDNKQNSGSNEMTQLQVEN